MALWRTPRPSGPSPADVAKLGGVLSALREVQRHVRSYKHDTQIQASHMNSVLDLLPEVADHDWDALKIDNRLHWQGDFVLRLEAAIAYLSTLMASWEDQLRPSTPLDGGKLELMVEPSTDDKPTKKRSRALSLIRGKS